MYSTSDRNGVITDVTWGAKLTSVVVTHKETGLRAKGHAKLHPSDEFNARIGFLLAQMRASSRLSDKLARRLASRPTEYYKLLDDM